MSESPSRASSIQRDPDLPPKAEDSDDELNEPIEPEFPIMRGKWPSPDDFLTDAEIRDRELAKVHQMKVDTNAKARRLAIMQENRMMLEQANAITRNPRRMHG